MHRRWFGIDRQRLLVGVGDVAPIVTGIAFAADTDQTGESVTGWFDDIRNIK